MERGVVEHDEFVELISALTNYVQNANVRAYNEGVDAERERCAKTVEHMGRSGGRVRASHKHVAAQIRSGNSRIEPIR
jgi:prephenate dehydrogenase